MIAVRLTLAHDVWLAGKAQGSQLLNWNQIERGLKAEAVTERMPDMESFQEDARARLSLVHQDATMVHRGRAGLWFLTSSLAAVAIAGALFLRPAVPAAAASTEVASLTVDVDHASVLIMNDASQDATIVWIADMEVADL
ncbi:MAG TPA: hypothetical protein DCR55_10505 [Lentisphaeria bacterium]|nr:hypothetical protein [Lentisphaeria bacterium]